MLCTSWCVFQKLNVSKLCSFIFELFAFPVPFQTQHFIACHIISLLTLHESDVTWEKDRDNCELSKSFVLRGNTRPWNSGTQKIYL